MRIQGKKKLFEAWENASDQIALSFSFCFDWFKSGTGFLDSEGNKPKKMQARITLDTL